jgi:hypothetical protein
MTPAVHIFSDDSSAASLSTESWAAGATLHLGGGSLLDSFAQLADADVLVMAKSGLSQAAATYSFGALIDISHTLQPYPAQRRAIRVDVPSPACTCRNLSHATIDQYLAMLNGLWDSKKAAATLAFPSQRLAGGAAVFCAAPTKGGAPRTPTHIRRFGEKLRELRCLRKRGKQMGTWRPIWELLHVDGAFDKASYAQCTGS